MHVYLSNKIHVYHPKRSEDAIKIHRTRATDVCEQACGFRKRKPAHSARVTRANNFEQSFKPLDLAFTTRSQTI